MTFARVAPTVDDLTLIPGNLAEQLTQWSELKSIPDELRAVITTADMDERIELAKMLSADDIKKLGLGSALQLVNAPTRKGTRAYWLDCAYMILEGYQIPLPEEPPTPIRDGGDLEAAEFSISCADIYLWLSRRREFTQVLRGARPSARRAPRMVALDRRSAAAQFEYGAALPLLRRAIALAAPLPNL